MKKISKLLLCVIFILVLLYGDINYQMSKDALMIWFEKLVPSMFGVMVLVKILFEQGILQKIGTFIGCILGPLFHIEKHSFGLVIACIFLGFPAGASFVNEQVMKGTINEKEGQRLICACSFPTPGFVIMSCGAVLFHSVQTGMLLFLIQILSGLFLLFFTRSTPIHATSYCLKSKDLMTSLKQAIWESGKTLYMIGGYLMLFMSCAAILVQFLPSPFQMFLRIIAEFSSGTMLLAGLPISQAMLFLCLSLLFSFGGFCVHMQVISMAKETNLPYVKYFSFRILQVLISALLAAIFLVLQ